MVNDIEAVNPLNDLPKFVDDIAIMAPVYSCDDSIGDEVENMKIWSNENRIPLSMEKITYEMIVRGKVTTSLPEHIIPLILRKEWIKLLGVTMEEIPGKLHMHFGDMMSLNKAIKGMYILRVCKHITKFKIQFSLDGGL